MLSVTFSDVDVPVVVADDCADVTGPQAVAQKISMNVRRNAHPPLTFLIISYTSMICFAGSEELRKSTQAISTGLNRTLLHQWMSPASSESS
jgi:hypothetical protein